jgi:tetratricopeptide (TPR) repeat protein
MDIDSLIRKADEALESGDDRAALTAGKRLVELRHVYGFEVLARAYWLREEKTKAIAALVEGVEKAPQVWPLWELLGDYRSDVGDVKRAREAYEQVLASPNADSAARAHALTELDRYDEAVSIARAALDANDLDPEERARLHYSIAYALWSKGETDGALKAAWEAIALHPSNEDAMWLIREIEGLRSDAARYYRLIVRAPKYDVSYAVVADDEDEARQLVTRFEPEGIRASLLFDEITTMRDADGLPKGVYWRGEE